MFALLAISPEYRCSKEQIAEYLWGKKLAESSWEESKKVHGLVDRAISDLRKQLGETIMPKTGKSGFCALCPPEESVDLLRLRAAVRRAEALPPRERFAELAAAVPSADYGEPLQGLRGDGFEARRKKLTAEVSGAVCQLLDAALKSGQEEWLREETEKWHARSPGHPRIFEFYLRAHGGNLSAKELDRRVAAWTKRYGPTGHRLQPVIEQLRAGTPRSAGRALLPIPNQLPPKGRRPIGREETIRVLFDYVCREQAAGRTAIILFTGLAGVGKSLVARDLAWLVRERFRDGALYGELNGFVEGDVQPTPPEQILDRFLPDLPPYSGVTGLTAKIGALRTALADRSVLILLDDARSSEQVLPLLPVGRASAVIITSRNTLARLRSENEVLVCTMEPLRDEDALALLQEKVMAKDRAVYLRDFTELIHICGNLPLALTVVARRMEHRMVSNIKSLVREMKDERRRLDRMDCPQDELSVRVALNCSVRVLSEEARLLLWQLGVHPGPSVTWEAVMDLGAAEGAGIRADRALEELVAASLVETRSGRFHLHDLVRAFAHHHLPLATHRDREALKQATVRQALEHQLHNVLACDRQLDRQRKLPIGDPTGVTVIELAGPEQAMEVLDREYPTIKGCIALAVSHRMTWYMRMLPMALVTYQWRRRRLDDAREDLKSAAVVAAAEADRADLAMVYRMLAGTYWRLEDFRLAACHLRRAVSLSEQDPGDNGSLSLARSLYTLGITQRKLDETTEAEESLRRALELYRQLSDPVGEAAALNAIGALHLDRGEHDEALHWCSEPAG
ncbi:tetratricopeptide repeat protein [Streptomyces sp. NPDC001985]|uniref:tetratricopeptide repeat protein n=1 Tax=Streptomyces sp. NPDC001985 TaxID=3154406 RepID=UPI0033237CEE